MTFSINTLTRAAVAEKATQYQQHTPVLQVMPDGQESATTCSVPSAPQHGLGVGSLSVPLPAWEPATWPLVGGLVNMVTRLREAAVWCPKQDRRRAYMRPRPPPPLSARRPGVVVCQTLSKSQIFEIAHFQNSPEMTR